MSTSRIVRPRKPRAKKQDDKKEGKNNPRNYDTGEHSRGELEGKDGGPPRFTD